MSKKDFFKEEEATSKALETLNKVSGGKKRKTRTDEYTEAEKQDAMESMQTSGKKGVKLPRMNLAFKPSNYDYLTTICASTGTTKTQFINKLIEESLNKNKKLYEQLKQTSKDIKF